MAARGSEGGNPIEMQSPSVTSCHPDQAGHRPGDLDTFLGLASHSHFFVTTSLWFVTLAKAVSITIAPLKSERANQANLVRSS